MVDNPCSRRARVGVLRASTLLAAGLVVGCGRSDGSDLPPADAAHWMEATCGIRFREMPRVLRSSVARSTASGSPASVVLTVVLPDSEADAAVTALARHRALHRRGQSATRHSYESYPDARPERACELDTSQHVLYLKYAP